MQLYIAGPESANTEQAIRANTPWLVTSRVTYAEVLSVLNRCLLDRRISREAYRLQKKTFLVDWSALHIVEVTQAVLQNAGSLIERHALRGFDALHLGSALWMGRPRFACFDERLRSAAEAEGLELTP